MPRGRVVLITFTVIFSMAALAACDSPEEPSPASSPRTTPARATATPSASAPPSTPSSSAAPSRSTSPAPRPGTYPPAWLGTRVLPHRPGGFGEIRPTPPQLRRRAFTLPDRLPMLPGSGFAVRASPVPRDVLARSTWAPGCPVAAGDLRWVRLTFWGFDDQRHTGELLVNRDAVDAMTSAFRSLYEARFPIEQMVITTKAYLDSPPTGDGNDTSAFACRPVRGGTSFSQHAYGRAVDVNPFQNPYTKGSLVLPELASSYVGRTWKRPGMILPGSSALRAFTEVGWGWGGAWQSLKDRQHFSANDR